MSKKPISFALEQFDIQSGDFSTVSFKLVFFYCSGIVTEIEGWFSNHTNYLKKSSDAVREFNCKVFTLFLLLVKDFNLALD